MKPGSLEFNMEIRLMKAEREARQWHRIATRLYDAHTDPDLSAYDRHDAIETYLNYHNPNDD
jgi:hypothetical protein